MENNEDKAIQEEIIDNLVKKNTELEKRINLVEGQHMPDYTASLIEIDKKLSELKSFNVKTELVNMLSGIADKLDNQSKPVNNIRLLLFPETNQGQYYKIVFGRLIPWGLGFMVATYIFITGYKAIELYRYQVIEAARYKDTELSFHCQRAWLYLQQHSKKKTLNAMDEAFVKTAKK
ncbi:MAG TPA: hypothetical protein VGM63_23065 [Mucilaginibacter sp.]|jgi:hypothetical protein